METFCEDFTNLFGDELGFPFSDGKKMDFGVFGSTPVAEEEMSMINITCNINKDDTSDSNKMEQKIDDMDIFQPSSDADIALQRLNNNNNKNQAQAQNPKQVIQNVNVVNVVNVKPKKQLKNRNRSSPKPRVQKRRSSVTRGRQRASTQPSTRSSSASVTKEARWKSWAHEEEVFLVGSVMDRFFRRGSLSSTRGSEEMGTDDCWAFIKANYDKAWSKYADRTGEEKPTERSVAALSRHYKVMKARISAADLQGDCTDSFREYYNEFEMMYNINNSLLGNSSLDSNSSVSPRNSPLNRIDRRKRKVRLSFTSRTRFDGRPQSRRDSSRSTTSCGTLDSTTSSTGSFYDEGGFVIKEESRFDEDEEYECS